MGRETTFAKAVGRGSLQWWVNEYFCDFGKLAETENAYRQIRDGNPQLNVSSCDVTHLITSLMMPSHE